jgi:hypothetical protein
MIRLTAAIVMFATGLAGADPFVGRLSLLQRILRFIVGLSAMLPIFFAWVPASLVALFLVVQGIVTVRKKDENITQPTNI